VRKARFALFAPAVLAAVVAGCGSSSHKSSTPSASSSNGYGAPASSASSTPAALITTKSSKKLGTILAAGSKRKTVYLFTPDTAGTSKCTGPCVAVWTPVTGTPQVTGGAISADLGTITRSDGTKQVTYKGHPLYFFSKDGDAGDAYGQGLKTFGGEWYALAPTGNKVDKS
jgi:predicted lipoprotein with Yx(FWY)xxD motif